MGNLTGDEMLVNEIKAGNALAFEAMVIKYQPKLLSSLIAYTKSHDQAEELCQKTFIRVWQKIDSFRGDSALFTWIYRIGINLAKNDFASSYSKNKKNTDPLDVSEHDISSHISPEVDLIGKEGESIIFAFIETLDIDLKTAFILIVVALILFNTLIMRWSRNIWINIFVHFDKNWKENLSK